MTVVSVATWRGTGATTSALLLAAGAAANGRDVWMIEADPAGGVLAARSELLVPLAGGLARVALPKPPTPPLQSWPLAATTLAGCAVVTGSGEPFEAYECLSAPTTAWIESLRTLADVVVVDVGSLRAGSTPAWRILDASDVVVLVTSPDPVALTASVDWCATRGRTTPGYSGLVVDNAHVVVVASPRRGRHRATPTSAAADAGHRLAGWWPWDAALVDAVLRGGALGHRRLARSSLGQAARATAGRLLEAAS